MHSRRTFSVTLLTALARSSLFVKSRTSVDHAIITFSTARAIVQRMARSKFESSHSPFPIPTLSIGQGSAPGRAARRGGSRVLALELQLARLQVGLSEWDDSVSS